MLNTQTYFVNRIVFFQRTKYQHIVLRIIFIVPKTKIVHIVFVYVFKLHAMKIIYMWCPLRFKDIQHSNYYASYHRLSSFDSTRKKCQLIFIKINLFECANCAFVFVAISALLCFISFHFKFQYYSVQPINTVLVWHQVHKC